MVIWKLAMLNSHSPVAWEFKVGNLRAGGQFGRWLLLLIPPYLQVADPGVGSRPRSGCSNCLQECKWVPTFYFDHLASLRFTLIRKSTMPLFTDYQNCFIYYLSSC